MVQVKANLQTKEFCFKCYTPAAYETAGDEGFCLKFSLEKQIVWRYDLTCKCLNWSMIGILTNANKHPFATASILLLTESLLIEPNFYKNNQTLSLFVIYLDGQKTYKTVQIFQYNPGTIQNCPLVTKLWNPTHSPKRVLIRTIHQTLMIIVNWDWGWF